MRALTIEAGCEFTAVESFVLDATDLAANGKKVAIRGDYQKIGEASYLCESEIGKGELNRCGISVPLLIQDAPRPLRAYLMRTWNAVPLGVFSNKAWLLQDLVLVGHADECVSHLWTGAEEKKICLAVENGWRLQNPATVPVAPSFVPSEWP